MYRKDNFLTKTTKPQNLSEVGDRGLQEEGGGARIRYIYSGVCFQSPGLSTTLSFLVWCSSLLYNEN